MLSTRTLRGRFAAAALLFATLLGAGCSRSGDAAAEVPPAKPEHAPPAATNAPAAAASTAPAAAVPALSSAGETRETWDVVTIQGARVGYIQTRVTRGQYQGRPAVRVEGVHHLVIMRAGDPSTQEIRFVSLETPAGKLIQFQTETQFGPAPMRTAGRVEGDRLVLETASVGKTENSVIPWPAECGGLYAMELSLQREPMQPGQTRTLRSLLPGLNVPVTSNLTAQRYESVTLLSGSYELLRIDTQVQFPDGTKLPGTVWVDRTGEMLKNFSELLNLETFRATKAQALDQKDVGRYDLMARLSIPLAKPMALGHAAKRVRYRLTLEGKDPAAVFVSGPSQQLRSLDAHTAELTVTALRPGAGPAALTPADRQAHMDDLRPSNYLQTEDPVVVAMAKEASAGAAADPWSVAVALERYVRQNITRKDFSQAFATAAEVARSRNGDCTEHALLLAALARVCGIPARVAVGLVYVEPSAAFGYHMWTEVYVAGVWIPADATLGRGGIGAAHLKLANSNLRTGDAFASFLPVLNVMGRLKIEVLREE
jgi:hypothetical protein